MSALKTGIDSAYAYRFIRLMQKSFSEWEAFQYGIIDENGSVLKRPKTPEEKSAYTPFHASVRSVKRMFNTIPGATSLAVMATSLSAIGSRFGLSESDWKTISKELGEPMYEMIAGDAGNSSGSPESIASGTTTGDLVNVGPTPIPAKKKHRKLVKLK